MVPSIWIVVLALPLLPSGKLNRRRTERYVTELDNESYQRVLAVGHDAPQPATEMTAVEKRLREIWGIVLKLPVETITFNSSFLQLVSA
jgi:hypothetical protein